MKEAFEKINNLLWHKQMQALSRFNELNDLPFNLRNCYDESDLEEAIAQSFEESQKIVSEVEAEYGNDVCEWKNEKGMFIQNPHTGRKFSNEPSMKNVYCNTCGKKIKVVGKLPEPYKPEK